MVECWSPDQEVEASSLTGVIALCPCARHINPCLLLVQPMKTLPGKTENMLTGT